MILVKFVLLGAVNSHDGNVLRPSVKSIWCAEVPRLKDLVDIRSDPRNGRRDQEWLRDVYEVRWVQDPDPIGVANVLVPVIFLRATALITSAEELASLGWQQTDAF